MGEQAQLRYGGHGTGKEHRSTTLHGRRNSQDSLIYQYGAYFPSPIGIHDSVGRSLTLHRFYILHNVTANQLDINHLSLWMMQIIRWIATEDDIVRLAIGNYILKSLLTKLTLDKKAP